MALQTLVRYSRNTLPAHSKRRVLLRFQFRVAGQGLMPVYWFPEEFLNSIPGVGICASGLVLQLVAYS
jgi:hypothetical protein